MKNLRIGCLLAVATLLISHSALGQVRYVRPDGDDDNNNGQSMGTGGAWRTLSKALAELSSSHAFNEIHVAKGTGGHTYKPGDEPEHTFYISEPIVIIGGYTFGTAEERDPGDRSILSGNLGENGNSFHIMTIEGFGFQVTLQGLHFTEGDARDDASYTGGALLALDLPPEEEEEEPELENNYSGPLLILDCEFSGNKAHDEGGAIELRHWRAVVSASVFVDNEVSGREGFGGVFGDAHGGAIEAWASVLSIKNSSFAGNSVNASETGMAEGGAIATSDATALICANCKFVGNSCRTTGSAGNAVDGTGGAVYAVLCDDYDDNTGAFAPVFTNCLFADNVAGMDGGAICGPAGLQLFNCTIADNSTTDGRGGGIFVGAREEESETTVTNSVLWANEATAETDPDDPDHQFGYRGSVVTFDMVSTCVQWPDLPSGNNNINDDPMFSDTNFRLSHCSPAVEAGDGALLFADVLDVNDNADDSEVHPWDLDHMKRFIFDEPNYVLDMGAYQTTCLGDVNRDGEIDGYDLGAVLGSWGTCPLCPTDFPNVGSCDGTVDGYDLGVVLGNWGACAEFEMQFMSGGGELEALMGYMGVGSLGELLEALEELPFEEMSEVLETFMGVE